MVRKPPIAFKPPHFRPGNTPLVAQGPPVAASDFPIVGIGASAGGLEACRIFVAALPADTGIAFILVQHLEPSHESMMVSLLAGRTSMNVLQAEDGMRIDPDHFYVIPPGTYLSIADGTLHLSAPHAHHGARLPFDFLLHSLAKACGSRAACVILSGTGADGSLGLGSIRREGGYIVAQNPDEAGYDGMPRSAIATGAVDRILPAADIPAALVEHFRSSTGADARASSPPSKPGGDWLPEILDILRANTAHDFKLYKSGTLLRRVERRVSMAGLAVNEMVRYIALLKNNSSEREALAQDLLINVTAFFRDRPVFDLLETKICPELVRDHPLDQPLRLWIAGCSTGEEAYSMAILLREQIIAQKSDLKLKIFASDVDPDAIDTARAGLYSRNIETEVSAERLARFFIKEGVNYRVMPDLRNTVIFAIHNVLADPPFSRLDFVSCRNLLIYLRPEAQAKVIELFHFSLHPGGLLLLGSSKSIGGAEGRFEIISKAERLYRNVGPSQVNAVDFSISVDRTTLSTRTGRGEALSRQPALAELCQRLVMENFAPAAVLVTRKFECLYSLGPTDRYLRVATGQPTHDILAMARQEARGKIMIAVQQVLEKNERIVVAGGGGSEPGAMPFNIDARPVPSEGDTLVLICFIDTPINSKQEIRQLDAGDRSVVAELERELETARSELRTALRSLEFSAEEQRAINEEAQSVNEEYQSTNEELTTSKEELQSLNEELTALNSQLQETLEKQRTTSDDLQNILYSTDVATLFLDVHLNIRFFTPATKLLFNVIPSDVGRPLADLNSLAADSDLAADALAVLKTLAPIEREISAISGAWYVRRILPYRGQDNSVGGVVITFVDVTEGVHAKEALRVAEETAQRATVAKSRFLAAASHDLRQPLQALTLLQGLIAKTVEGKKAQTLVKRFDHTLKSMSGMLDALLDINQIESGAIRPDIIRFSIGDLLHNVVEDFADTARMKNLALRVVPCSVQVQSDLGLVEQIVRNLLSNALKYTSQGKVLVGCRRRGKLLRIEIWDSGIGIAAEELQSIFEEYHQLDNEARQRSHGLGLGLFIVQRLGTLLGHKVHVRSWPGSGSVFWIDLELAPTGEIIPGKRQIAGGVDGAKTTPEQSRTILIVEDDPEVRELLNLFLTGEGHTAVTAANGKEALDITVRGLVKPDLILADYNLPNGLSGTEMTSKLREALQWTIPAVVLTGDISSGTLQAIQENNCVHFSKPVKLTELSQTIHTLLTQRRPEPSAVAPQTEALRTSGAEPIVFVVDDDSDVREAVRSILEHAGRIVEVYPTSEEFLAGWRHDCDACLLVDANLPGMSGLELLNLLKKEGRSLPSIMITGVGDVTMAVQAMKAGAIDFIEKPIGGQELIASVAVALEQSRDAKKAEARRDAAASQVSSLTKRQLEILELVLAGHPSKNIAADLGISQRTVENHRAAIMRKTGSKSLPALARLALAASDNAGTTITSGHASPAKTA